MHRVVARLLGVSLFATIAVGAACGDGEPSEKLQVVTTTELVADFVRQIGGELVEVSALIPSGADPHTFEPSPGDVALISQADIVFVNGLGLEAATISLIETNIGSSTPLVKLGDKAGDLGFRLVGGDDEPNPHLWLDPDAIQFYLSVIGEQLLFVAPGNESVFAENRQEYFEEFDAAVAYLAERVAEVSLGQRVLVTTHDAFPYLARAMGFEIGAFVAVGPGQEPSPRAVADLVEVIRQHDLKAVFREPQVGPEGDVLEQAARDAGAEICVLLSDAFEGEAESYVDLVRHNADELARCLGG